jgi:putative protein-disulfide isomerase
MMKYTSIFKNRQCFRYPALQFLAIAWFCCISVTACGQVQNNSNHSSKQPNMENQAQNPLLCDPATGVCEVPNTIDSTFTRLQERQPKPIHLIYFTDPICSSCWGIEPQLRKLRLEYGAYFEIEYRMGGLLPGWEVYSSGGISGPKDVAHHWDEVSQYYKMPIDGDVWLEDPLSTSYPPSIAFKAAQIQDPEKAQLFLRRIKEMVFTEKKNITQWQHLQQAATEAGLNVAQFKADYEGPAKALFEADLKLAQQSGVRGFPTIFFNDNSGKSLKVYGSKPYADFEQAILQLLPEAQKTTPDMSAAALFGQYPTLTAMEFALLSNQTYEQAKTVLQQLAADHKVKTVTTKNGNLWIWEKSH